MTALLDELVAAAATLVTSGLVTGAGGNVSVRDGDRLWISPSGFSFEDARAHDYPCLSVASGEVLAGERRPSSEVLMHLAIARARPAVRCIVHAHPPMTVALCSAGHDLRALFPDYHVYLGRHVPHLDYVTVTTPALADAVGTGFAADDVHGMVLRNHGTITVGASVKQAVFRTRAMEEQATIQWHASVVGTPRWLTDAELDELDQLGSEAYRRQLLAAMGGDGSAPS